jgi:aryl-alcohol dehydrogenase-like predicted oxidoreductase
VDTWTLGPFVVPIVGLGCNTFGRRIEEAATRAVVDAALDAGVTLFDTADVYGDGASEELIGRALRGRHDEVVIATKFGMTMDGDEARSGAHPSWIARAVDDSLRRLDTDVIDLYQQHRPDADVPIAETLGALHELVVAGKVRAIGCSNFSAEQIDEAQHVASDEGLTPFVSVQNRYSVLTRDPEEEGVVDACARHGLALLPYFPLESGLLTGKYSEGLDAVEGRLAGLPEDRRDRFVGEGRLEATARLTAFAQERGRTILDLAFSWLAAQPTVASVIAGATRPEQVNANAAAASWSLGDDELATIDRLVAADGD